MSHSATRHLFVLARLAGVSVLVLSVALPMGGAPSSVLAASPDIVISQVYGGGGNTGAPLTNDYIELFNRGAASVNLSGWSVQYASATGTGNFGATSTQITELPSMSLAPGRYLLIQEAGGATGSPLPTPDVTDASPINMSATAGKVIVANIATGLGCNGGSTPCSPAQLASIIDLLGYGSANFFEGTAAGPTLSNTTAAFRALGGCTDTDDNSADFSSAAPAPRNSSTPAAACGGTGLSGVGNANPDEVPWGGTSLLTVAVTPATKPPSMGITVVGDLSGIGGSATQSFLDDGTQGDEIAGDSTYSYGASIPVDTPTCSQSVPVTVSDAEGRSAGAPIALKVLRHGLTIHEIQGAGHRSPFEGQCLSGLAGVVTLLRSNGFYFQEPAPDGDPATSEALFVYTASAPGVSEGDHLSLLGEVEEYRPGGDSTGNLTTTELIDPEVMAWLGPVPIPTPALIGLGGRTPPTTIIDDDSSGDVEVSSTFDPSNDGLDFYESLEGMRVQVNNPLVVGPTNSYGEIPVTADLGAGASLLTPNGGLVVRLGDFNPERIILDDAVLTLPSANVGDSFSGPAVGVLDYSFGNFKLLVTSPLAVIQGELMQELAPLPGMGQLAVATLNVENLSPNDPADKFATLADLVVNHLHSPDILAVEEIQDNNGSTNDTGVAADVTYTMLIDAIITAGGPTYSYRQIDPLDDQDGGEPGGNIRQGFLYHHGSGLTFYDMPGGDATTATAVVGSPGAPQLSLSPGRILPTSPAFTSSRKPLAGEFVLRGWHLFVIANHFNSKGGDDPLFGRLQPPVLASEAKRLQQAQVVNDFVDSLLALDPEAMIIVLGDLNDFQFSAPLATLAGGVLTNGMNALAERERYSYVYDGNSQALDHILYGSGLAPRFVSYNSLHVNAEFADGVSDHDPQLMLLDFAERLFLPLILR